MEEYATIYSFLGYYAMWSFIFSMIIDFISWHYGALGHIVTDYVR